MRPVYVALLGVGFIALEIYAIQQTRLFLGHPTWAVAAVLFVFLVGGGMGSGLSQVRMRAALARRPQLATALVVALALAWTSLWAVISGELLTASLPARLVAAVISLLPLAMCMGIPFPQALAEIGQGGGRGVALAWSVNGAATVAGSILAGDSFDNNWLSCSAVAGRGGVCAGELDCDLDAPRLNKPARAT